MELFSRNWGAQKRRRIVQIYGKKPGERSAAYYLKDLQVAP
jgi:hypothetical protein